MAISGVFNWVLNWLQEWSVVISGLGSLVLSGALVVLYYQQRDLLKRDMNRDVREQHSEILRERIREWHGDLEEIGYSVEDGVIQENSNLPRVLPTSVFPAPVGPVFATEDTGFRVVPASIANDRYLIDLLDNHAPELKQMKEKIESRHDSISENKDKFSEEFSAPGTIEADSYTLVPLENLSEWAFNQVVRLNRETLDNEKKALKEMARSGLSSPSSGVGEDTILYDPTTHGSSGKPTFKVVSKTGDSEDIEEDSRQDISERLIDIHTSIISDIEDEACYPYAVNAAENLDQMKIDIYQLKQALIEYEGRPLYTGDCKYLKEAKV